VCISEPNNNNNNIIQDQTRNPNQTRGASHNNSLAIYIKMYIKAKEELKEFKCFTIQKYNLLKHPLKESKILQDIITL
jgi:hypothetical protein